ncbi:MAG: hypothetical protein EA414_11010 [Arthrospira sp. PLM2.Bin9]|nr:MAG: hypothetical protein EA414_11010 [Arthrospira sp. PLM2.Bin9]
MKSKRMSPTTGFLWGSVFTLMLALLLLFAWLFFSNQSSLGKDEPSPPSFPSGILPPPPNVSESTLGTFPNGQIPIPTFPLPPAPSSSDSSSAGSHVLREWERQQATNQQIITQLERHRVQIDQLTSQLERHRVQIETLTTQLEQQRMQNERLTMQLQEQERRVSNLTLDQNRLSQGNSAANGLPTAMLWFLVGVILAVVLGGSIFAVGLIVMVTQSNRRSELKRYSIQPIDIWPYRIEEEPADFLPPNMRSRRSR